MDDGCHLWVMGSRSVACTADGDNTYLALGGPSGTFLIDCGGSPVHKLPRAGLDPLAVRGVLFTHAHPDHVYGFPALVQYRVEMRGMSNPPSGVSITYSGDTGPSDRLVEAAAGSDRLIHECSVDTPQAGHSTPEQAADAAARADVKRLVLIHYPPELAADPDAVVDRCSRRFSGPVSFAGDGDRFPVGPAG